MKNPFLFTVPPQKRVRVIVHTDCKNEADDQFALAHHLMTPRFDVRGIIAGHFDNKPDEGKQESMQKSYDEIIKVLELMELEGQYKEKVFKGAKQGIPSEFEYIDSEGADFIIKEAMKENDLPLFVVCLGAITDLACALLKEPRIAKRVTAIWIGGGQWPHGDFEFNLWQDIHAANVVFQSDMEVWQVPKNVYKMMKISITELQCKVRPYGKIGRYLFDQLVEYNNTYCEQSNWPHGESWCLGDQPTVSLLLEHHECDYDWKPAPCFSQDMSYIHGQRARAIRVYHHVDARLTFEDFFCKLMLHYPAD